jgi:trimeric autotransporter adhesin
MASITTRQTGTTGVEGVTRKNLPLTNTEIDTNFISLNNNKLEASWTGNTSIVTLGTITTGTWNATTIATNRGGTGLTSFTNGGAVYATSTSALTTGTLPVASGGTGLSSTPSNGQLDIGNGTGFTRATLTGTANRITVTNGTGSITLSCPQDIATTSNPQFGSLGIGTTASGTAGDFRSNTARIESLGVGTVASGTAGEIRATNEITSYYSDERLKENIEVITSALDKVMLLRGVTYNANQLAESFGFINKEKQVGVLANDVYKVLPEAVKPAPFDIMMFENAEISKSGEHYKTVQYEKLVPLLIEAIKDLNNQIKEIKGIK